MTKDAYHRLTYKQNSSTSPSLLTIVNRFIEAHIASQRLIQSQKTQGFVSQNYLTKEGRIRKLFYCLIWIKEPCVRKFEGLTRSKILGILQTVLKQGLKAGECKLV